jgi:hypothetical protein
MLFHFKTSIKTSILLLLFIMGNNSIIAGNPPIMNVFLHQFTTSGNPGVKRSEFSSVALQDTIQTQISKIESTPSKGFILPDSLAGKMINFQVNSDISYLTFNHFIKSESKEMFYQAWLKKSELKRVSSQTDSLRKVYSVSGNDKKEEIAVLILKNEEHSAALNQEISNLYQTARENENQYWINCPASERIKFQEKIKSFRDSITLRRINEEAEKASKIMIDTLFAAHESSQNKEAKSESSSAIVYKIQIGAFKGKIPDPSNSMIKKLSVLRKVENYTDEKGVKIYTTGNLKIYQEALTMQNQVKQEGVKNPVIIAFQNGKKITVEEARKINKEQ